MNEGGTLGCEARRHRLITEVIRFQRVVCFVCRADRAEGGSRWGL